MGLFDKVKNEFEFGKSESIFEVQSYLAKIILWKE